MRVVLFSVAVVIFGLVSGLSASAFDVSALHATSLSKMTAMKWNGLLDQITSVNAKLSRYKPIFTESLMYGYCEGRVQQLGAASIDTTFATPSDKLQWPAVLINSTCACDSGYVRVILGCDSIGVDGAVSNIYYSCVKP